MTEEFDPNNPGKDTTRRGKNWNYDWATYVPNRTPKFKVHPSKGHATSAVKDKAHLVDIGETWGYRVPDDVKLYQKVDGLWVDVVLFTREWVYTKRIDLLTGKEQ